MSVEQTILGSMQNRPEFSIGAPQIDEGSVRKNTPSNGEFTFLFLLVERLVAVSVTSKVGCA